MATSTRGTAVKVPDDISSLVDHSKHPASPAAGPYGHPFHPILVTIPIGAWMCSLVFDVASKLRDGGESRLVFGSYWLIGIGLVGAALAAVFGLMDLSRLSRGTTALKLGLAHMALNLTTVALFAVNLMWRHDTYYEDAEVRTGQLVMTIAALALLSLSGWIGGMLAYRYGVRVAHETDQAEGFRSPTAT
jgi:uncharacterized membrane protein